LGQTKRKCNKEWLRKHPHFIKLATYMSGPDGKFRNEDCLNKYIQFNALLGMHHSTQISVTFE